MPKSATIRARIEPDLKEEAEGVFHELGLSVTQAITLFYQQVKLSKGLPFEVRIPNTTTIQTFEDTDAGRKVTKCENAQALFEQLGL